MNDFLIENGVLIKYVGNGNRAAIPDGVRAIGDQAFADCADLTQIEIPDTVTEIGNYAFYRCSALKGITIPSRVYRIGDGAFFGCLSLTEIVIPDSVTAIGERLLGECPSIRKYTLPPALADTPLIVGNVLIRSGVVRRTFGKVDKVILPDNVTAIGDGAFYRSTLTEITLPDGITSVGNRAFRGCSSLSAITLPEGTISIGEEAFCNCRSLSHITVPDSVINVGENAFHGISYDGQLHIKPRFMTVTDGQENESAWCAAVRGAVIRYSQGKMTEAETAEWRQYLCRRTVKAFNQLPDEPMLYGFLTDTAILAPKRAEALLDETENTECRAILLEYINKRKKRKNKIEDTIDSLFSIENE